MIFGRFTINTLQQLGQAGQKNNNNLTFFLKQQNIFSGKHSLFFCFYLKPSLMFIYFFKNVLHVSIS